MHSKNIRNFAIVAHIDHGKTTLTDRILEVTGAVSKREMVERYMDKMDLEKERGITIKAQTVRLNYRPTGKDEDYILNLIDTPGHVDFTYEVSRSLAACEGAILLVDASQGVEAQTLANALLALENNLEIVPAINKIDLPQADAVKTAKEIENTIGIDATEAISVSAKSGKGVPELLDRIIEKVPPPTGNPDAPLKALLFDSWYSSYHGVVCLIRLFDGKISQGMKVKFVSSGKIYEVDAVGTFSPEFTKKPSLEAGEVGYLMAGVKSITDIKIGDTITEEGRETEHSLPGFKEMKPVVFCGIFPINEGGYALLKDALEKLRLNDSSFIYEPETSNALGFGFRCGFLGLLHMEIIQERLEREYNLDLVTTAPTVVFHVYTTDGQKVEIDNPALLPEPQRIERIEEPIVAVSVHSPEQFLGNILELCESKRGTQTGMEYIGEKKLVVRYDLPLVEIVFDFYDKLKSVSKGYASLDYELKGFKASDMVKLDILVNGDPVDALSVIVHKERAFVKGKALVWKLRKIIPRQMFDVAIQAAIGARVVARETVKAMRKNVLAKCYGGDVTRKRKLLEKQKEGKKRMKQVGNVEIPQEAFLAVLKED
jgi:GTP-binding protein LepA